MTGPVLLIGKNGQLGHDLADLLPALGELIALGRLQLDLSSPAQIRQMIREVRPRLIVNAAAYTSVDKAETDEIAATVLNAEAPGVIAEEARKVGAGIVHYSTDYVFDGTKTSPYDESDRPHPVSVYGRTKLAGEAAIRESGVPHLIFRTAWVYTTRGRNFLLTILRLASEREELRVVADQVGAPTWSREIATATKSVLERVTGGGGSFSLEKAAGTYHMTADGVGTWWDFANAIVEHTEKAAADLPWLDSALGRRPLLVRRIVPIITADYLTPARRPAYSVLSNSKLNRVFGVQLPDWRTQLNRVFEMGSPDS